MDNRSIIPANMTNHMVDSIFDMIAKDSRVVIGKKRRTKIKTQLRAKLMQGNIQLPCTSLMTENMDQSDVDNFDDHSFTMPKYIELENVPGRINLHENCVNYSSVNYRDLDDHLINLQDHWHMVLIHHKNLDKRVVIQNLYEAVQNEFFTPIAYSKGREVDYFLICNQRGALKKLFENGLKFNINGTDVRLSVKLRVGSVEKIYQQIVLERVIKSIKDQMDSAGLDDRKDVFDFSDYSKNPALEDVEISLGNKACMTFVFDQINGSNKLKSNFRVFKFQRNNITTLEPFTKLFDFNIKTLDLRHNRISSIQEFHFLKHLKIEELYLNGNSCSTSAFYRERIQEIIPSVVTIDGMQFGVATTSAPPTDGKKTLKSYKSINSGTGNDPIKSTETGVEFRGDTIRNKEEFSRIRDSFGSYRNDTMWTQISVQPNNFYKPEELLEEMTASLFINCSFYPCYYKRYGNRDEFFLYKNFQAVQNMICCDNLQFRIPPSNKKVTFSVRLNAAIFQNGQVDWFYKICYVLTKRISNNVLNLNEFVNDPEFSKIVVTLNTKWSLNFILGQALKQNNQITRINAQGNGITTLDGFQSLTMFSKLVALDLRNNKICSMVGISMTTAIKDLRLDGNPICEKLRKPHAYVSEIKSYFSELEWLDGHKLDEAQDMAMLQNYLVNRDAYTIADEFVKTYFNIYDSFERHRLFQLYHEHSIFSLSIHYDIAINLNSLPKDIFMRIQKYVRFSRNLYKISNLNKAAENFKYGAEIIGKVLNELPKTTHDFGSLCIDVPYYNPKERVVITVSGVFQDHCGSLNETNFLIGFVRTFILQPTDSNEYLIANEQLFLHNPSQAQRDQLIVKRLDASKENFINQNCRDVLPTESEENQMKLLLFQELTELKKEEAFRQLDESHWDLKVTLATFNTLMDSREIADDLFDYK